MFVGHRGISTGLIYEKKLIEIGFGEPGETHHGKKTKKWPFSVETPKYLQHELSRYQTGYHEL